MPEPAANVDPEDMRWGYENDGSGDYVHWYPDGDKFSDYYLMFEDGYLTIDDGGKRTNMPMQSEDGHYVNSFEGDPAVDFVFLDNLTCYDLVGEQWPGYRCRRRAYRSCAPPFPPSAAGGCIRRASGWWWPR